MTRHVPVYDAESGQLVAFALPLKEWLEAEEAAVLNPPKRGRRRYPRQKATTD